MWQYLIPAGISLLQTAYDASQAKKNKPKLFENTFEGRRLAGVAKTGSLTPQKMAAINAILNTQMGGIENTTASAIRGSQIRGGMENSISAGEPYAQLGIGRQRTLANTGTNLWMMNEASKERAADLLAAGKDESRGIKRQWQADFNQNLAGGIGQAAQMGLQGYADYRTDQSQRALFGDIQSAISSGDYERARSLVPFIGTDYYQSAGKVAPGVAAPISESAPDYNNTGLAAPMESTSLSTSLPYDQGLSPQSAGKPTLASMDAGSLKWNVPGFDASYYNTGRGVGPEPVDYSMITSKIRDMGNALGWDQAGMEKYVSDLTGGALSYRDYMDMGNSIGWEPEGMSRYLRDAFGREARR